MIEKKPLFTLYKDGIGVNDYSVRLTNFSLNNIPTNLTRLTVWTASIATIAGYKIGVTTSDWMAHYILRWNVGEWIERDVNNYMQHEFARLIAEKCHMIYDPSRQDEYLNGLLAKWKTVSSMEYRSFTLNLDRGNLQPIYSETEECVKELMNQAVETVKIITEKRQEEFDEMLPYAAGVVAVTTAAIAGYATYSFWNQNRNNLTTNHSSEHEKTLKI